MDAAWSNGVYPGDVPTDFDEVRKREDRRERISQYWDLLVVDQEPRVTKGTLLQTMQDLKDEGNILFKECHYDIAWMHYRNALFIARILSTRFYHEVDKEFLSTLFSNRAFCCLKKDMYQEAIQDCESAIRINENNIKAYYRQVLGLKAQKKLAEALKIAEMGYLKQPAVFKDVVEELREVVVQQTKSYKTQVSVNKATTVTDAPDPDWLKGTNVRQAKENGKSKPKETVKSSKNGSLNTRPVKTNIVSSVNSGILSETEDSTSDSDQSEDRLSEDETFANTFLTVQNSKQVQRPTKKPVPVKVDIPKNKKNSIGDLDSFSPTAQNTYETSPSIKRTETVVEQTNQKHVEPTNQKRVEPTNQKSPTKPAAEKKTVTLTLDDIYSVKFPLNNYDFKLACQICFKKSGEGINGSHLVETQHICAHNTLIVKLQQKSSVNWMKIRPRIESKFQQYGGYKLCTHFQGGRPCKVREDYCTFAHNRAEVDLWNMDRVGDFIISEYILKLRSLGILSSEQMASLESKLRQLQKQEIPGMSYRNKKPVEIKQTLPVNPEIVPREPVKEEAKLEPENKPVPAASVNVEEPVKPLPPTVERRPPLLQNPPRPPMSHQSAIYTGQPLMSGPIINPNMMYPPNFSQPPPPFRPVMHPPHLSRFAVPPPPLNRHTLFHAGPPRLSQPPPVRMPAPQHNAPKLEHNPMIIRQSEEPKPVKISFPYRDTHDYRLLCKNCCSLCEYGKLLIHDVTHKCEEDIFGVRAKTSRFYYHVRERKNHREFIGRYKLCNSYVYGNPTLCLYGPEVCSFAHNEIEQNFWTLEKDENFSITEFILQNRSQRYTMMDILRKHDGNFSFICRACFNHVPMLISFICEDNRMICSGDQKHPWPPSKILAHFGIDGTITMINSRGFLHKTAFFKLCKWLKYCRNSRTGDCRFAHSFVERDIWMLERDTGLTQEEIVNEVNKILSGRERQQQAQPTVSSTPTLASAIKSSANQPMKEQRRLTTEATEFDEDACPWVILQICSTCWKSGQKSIQDGNRDRCAKSHSNWSANKMLLLAKNNKEIRPLPVKIPKGFRFIMCKGIQERNKCAYTGQGYCTFAHSEEELKIWQWMCAHEVKTTDELYKRSKEAQESRAEKNKIGSGESVVTVQHSKVVLPTHIKASTHYCPYCGVQCNSQKQWDEHCASEKHNFNVNSDKEHQWNYRQPPWGLSAVNYTLCPYHTNGNKCQYSNVPDMYNLCQNAHSQEELDEWRERYEWRQMKRDMARQEQVFSFMDQLVEQYENEDSSVKVITESLPGVTVISDEKLNVYEEEKNANFTWKFIVKSKIHLERVALLYNRDRLHFNIQSSDKSCQISPGIMFEDVDSMGNPCYVVRINFNGTMFGSFSQWVVFDFGSQPYLVRKLSVEVGAKSAHEKVRSLRQKLKFDRWTSENREIVRFDTKFVDELGEKLKRQYKAPSSSDTVITQYTVATELNRNNYQHKMHNLLELEEIERHKVISSYNLCTTIELQNAIQGTTYLYAQSGELFAKVPLRDYLTEDTDAGKLILTSVRTVLLAPINQNDNKVYEAIIVGKENYDYDGRGKEHIYIALSPQFVTAMSKLGHKTGSDVEVEIQFQMDRGLFCMMHYAIDSIKSTETVFPDISRINPQWSEKHQMKVSSNILNGDQIQAVQHIVAERTSYTPPFVIYGAFGTGKTETMGQAAMVLLKERPDARVLICTQSNSAADLYITKHLDPFLTRTKQTHLLRRVYFTERRVNTVSPVVQKYCLISKDRTMFEIPTKEDVLKHRIVIVTLSTSLVLTNIGAQDLFTHIFVDEAAQALEAETIMPLTLAGDKTCIILAGDHKQISPKVYNIEARRQKFNMSLLERLHLYYDSYSNRMDKSASLNLLLSINYRTKMEILRFISSVFYGGPDVLISQANLPSVLEITPLMFYGVQGVEIQDTDSVSYYNTSEVQEVVERVKELYDNWPSQWGPRQAKEIGVVTPYYDQVQLIRKSLRKRHPDLNNVTVERVNNVQGKEFRALFISTVRTRSLIDSASDVDICGDFGFLSDPKLLNTALTRAQSFVAVVGDPVALCAIGECTNVWRTYLQHCRNMKSIRPNSITVELIKQQVSNMMNSTTAKDKMSKITESRKPVSQPPPLSKPQKMPPWKMAAGDSLPTDVKKPSDTDSSVYNYCLSADGALRQLADMDKALQNGDINIQVVDNLAVVCNGKATSNSPLSPEHLNSLIASNPFRYRQCVLKYSQGNWYAQTVDSKLPNVNICCKRDCHGAFPGDTVVIEMLEDGENGFVVGVLKDGFDWSERAFICHVDPENTGILVPVDAGICSMYNVITPTHINRVNKGYVCVYSMNKNGKVTFNNYERVNIVDPCDKLFVVKYLQWNDTLEVPLCIVVGICDTTKTMESIIDVLDINYSVPTRLPDDDNIYPTTLPDDIFSTHTDLRSKWMFTLSSPKQDTVSAFNIEETSDGHYVLGVHISDVTYFISKDSPLDLMAKQHMVSPVYPGQPITPIIPSRLAQGVCSFRTGTDYPALSVFLTVKKTGDVIGVDIKSTVINSKQNFTLCEVEDILNESSAGEDYLKSCILVLFYIGGQWRQKRLGNAALYFDLDVDEQSTPESSILMKEIMIGVNWHVGQYLLQNVPDVTPVICQSPPREAVLRLWKIQYASDALNSIALTQPFLDLGCVCRCKVACTCIISFLRQNNIRINDSFSLYTIFYSALRQAVEVGDIHTIQKIVVSAESHPQLMVAYQKLKELLESPTYNCAASVTDRGVFSLNLSNYTHMTDPMTNYMDLVVHRLLKSVVNQLPVPYHTDEVTNLCEMINKASKNIELHSQAVNDASLCQALRCHPLAVYPVIEAVTENEIKLCFPSVTTIPEQKQTLSLDLFKPVTVTMEKQDVVCINFQGRIYDHEVKDMDSCIGVQLINPDQFISKIPSFQWQKLIIAIREENAEKLQTSAASLPTSVVEPNNGLYSVEVSSEPLVKEDKTRHTIKMERKFTVGNVVQVQLAHDKSSGIPVPAIQLVNLTPMLDICIEHRSNPMLCFTTAKDIAPITQYNDEDTYMKAWLSILNLEASVHAVSHSEAVIIHNVTMMWHDNKDFYTGTFTLSVEFCTQRQLTFSCHGYFCIRYKGLEMREDQSMNERTALIVNNGVPVTWVGHGILYKVDQKNDCIQVEVKLTQSSVRVPVQLLSADTVPCTVEWIPKCQDDMFIEEAMLSISESSQLARDIAKHRNPVPLEGSKSLIVNPELIQQPVLDNSQKEALSMAFTKPFTVLRGPAGSGKSTLAACLALNFVEKNRRTPRTDIKPQVLICGPTEQTLDAIADYLKQCKNPGKIIRVYSEDVEQKDFPSYGESHVTGSKVSSAVMTDLALHHRIRGPSSQFSESIQEHDMLLQLYPDDFGREQVDEYKATVMKAEVAELREADIIMCMCVTSARSRLRQNSNVVQIIIDDCNLCTEPESMTPIILNRNVQQVTLLGDTHGLKPIVHSRAARLLGLQTSLMEPYNDKTMDLKLQYRMHDGISELSAELFYNNALISNASWQRGTPALTFWPNKPVLFCHVHGQEEWIKDSTGNSLCNRNDANCTVSTVTSLLRYHKVGESSIVVMSPYLAQCQTIIRGLLQQGVSNVEVTSVLQGQGRQWDYVVVSLVRSVEKNKIEKTPSPDWIQKFVGDVADSNQINIMLTRARHGLIFVGNYELLEVCSQWKMIINRLQRQGQIMDAVNFLRLI